MGLTKIWTMFSPHERKNIAIYIAGIMFYKFGLEAFNGSITTMATDRFHEKQVFGKVGILTALNQAMQCVGSILIAPLISRFATKNVLSSAVLAFSFLSVILLICDAATGGRIKHAGEQYPVYGRYSPNAIYPIYIATGVAYGMVELIRRVIPRDIVGGHVGKLKRMDAIVHILYEVAGTIGAFSGAALIKRLGNNYAFIVTPICFALAGIVWHFVSADFRTIQEVNRQELVQELSAAGDNKNRAYLVSALHGFRDFGRSVSLGARIVLGRRKFWWLIPGYSFALFGHRYLENNLAIIYAERILGESSFQLIILGGSNLGELLGALTVLVTANVVPTPIPFIRLDAILLLIVWYLPWYKPVPGTVIEAWKIAATFIPISFGWAAGDVSLTAYIQSSLARMETRTEGISALGAVMAFLYVTYILIYTLLSPLLGLYADKVFNRDPDHKSDAFIHIGGVHFTVLSVIMIAATFVPRGALSLNPKLLDNEILDNDLEDESTDTQETELNEKEIAEKVAVSDPSMASH